MPSVESLTVNYDFLNEQGTFSEGDIVTGNVTLTLAKDTKVQSLFVKLKGDANVRWSEKRGDKTKVYSADTRYFKLKQFLTPEVSDGKITARIRSGLKLGFMEHDVLVNLFSYNCQGYEISSILPLPSFLIYVFIKTY